MVDKTKKPRDELTLDEQEFLNKKTVGMKWLSVFLAGIGLLWSRRRGALVLCLGIAAVCALGGEGGEIIGVIITRCITLIKFTEKAYNHGNKKFLSLLDVYRKEHGVNKRILNESRSALKTLRNNSKDSDIEENIRIGGELINLSNNKFLHGKNSIDNKKYDSYGFDKDGYNREGYDAYGFDREGYNRDGYNEQGYDVYGFDRNGYNYKGFNRNGFDKNGYNRRGFDKDGYDKDGYDEYGDKKKYNKKNNKKIIKKTTKKIVKNTVKKDGIN